MRRQKPTTRKVIEISAPSSDHSYHAAQQPEPFNRQKHDLTRRAAPDSHTGVRIPPDLARTPIVSRRRDRSRAIPLVHMLTLVATSAMLAFATGADAARPHYSDTKLGSDVLQTVVKTKQKHMLPAIKMKLLGAAVSSVYTDGVRWAAYEPSHGVTRVMDTIAGTSVKRDNPEGCAGGLEAMGGGELLYDCTDPMCPPEHAHLCVLKWPEGSLLGYETFARFVMVDIATGAQHVVVGTEGTSLGASMEGASTQATVHFGGPIGSQWMTGGDSEQLISEQFFLNWHTGLVISESGSIGTPRDYDWEDLNSEQLMQPLCRPLRRPLRVQGGENAPLYVPAAYAPSLAVIEVGEEGKRTPQLLHCGSSKHVSLPSCGGPQFGGGALSCGIELVTQLAPRRYPWHKAFYKVSPPAGEKYSGLLQHTSTTILTTFRRDGQGYGVIGDVYDAQLPWAKPKSGHRK